MTNAPMATSETITLADLDDGRSAGKKSPSAPAPSGCSASPFSVFTLLRTYRWRILVTYGLLNLENFLCLMQPYCLGQAINGLLHSSHAGIGLFAAQYLAHSVVSTVRRVYDTRAFTAIYTDTVVQLVMQHRHHGADLSTTTARSALSQAYVDFYQQHLPVLLQGVYCVVGGLLMLGAYDPWLVPLCLLLFIPASPLALLYRQRTLFLNNRLHDQLEQEVDAIQCGRQDAIQQHYASLAHWRIRLSDSEARNFLTLDLFVLAMIAIVLLRSCGHADVAAGDIYAVFRYVVMFVTGIDAIPFMIQHISRLQDIGQRIRSGSA